MARTVATLPAGSRSTDYVSLGVITKAFPLQSDQRNRRHGIVVRVIEYTLEGVPDAEPIYRLLTTILDQRQAPAKELASL